MCNFKSFVLLPDLQVRWYEGDYHSVILDSIGREDKSEFDKNFLKLEVLEGNVDNYTLDEDDTDNLPSWYTEHEREYKNKVKNILIKILDIKHKMDEVNAIYTNDLEKTAIEHSHRRSKLRQELEENIEVIKEKENLSDNMSTWRELNNLYDKTRGAYKDYEDGLEIIDNSYERECIKLCEIHRTKFSPLLKKLKSIEGYI